MKQSLTFKSLLIAVSLLSLFAFAFVNIRSHSALVPDPESMKTTQNKIEETSSGETDKISVPNMSVIGRIWEITQRLLEKAN